MEVGLKNDSLADKAHSELKLFYLCSSIYLLWLLLYFGMVFSPHIMDPR